MPRGEIYPRRKLEQQLTSRFRYLNGIWATIGCQLLSLLLLSLLSLTYTRRNKLVKEGKYVAEGQPGFLYTI